MKPGSPHAADHLENFLKQTKLVWGKWVVFGKILPVHIGFEGHPAIPEGQLVAKDIAFFSKDGLQIFYYRSFLFQQPFLDHLIGIGTGQGQTGLKPALNLGEIVLGGRPEFTQDFIDLLLGRHDHPGFPLTKGAKVFRDGL